MIHTCLLDFVVCKAERCAIVGIVHEAFVRYLLKYIHQVDIQIFR